MDASSTYTPSGTKRVASETSLPTRPPSAPVRSTGERERHPWHSFLKDLLELVKPEITFLVTLSALAGFLLGSDASIDWPLLFHTLLGTALTGGGSGVLNHFWERHIDKAMRRTSSRPLPSGRVSATFALGYGLTLIAAGVIELLMFVNPTTALLAGLTAGLYLVVYTPLKRVTAYNTLIGCFPGALPPLGGWVAAAGTFGLGGWLLFGILFTWQMPHFLSLAWMYRQDYARANLMMLPVVEPDGTSTGRQTLLFTALLVGLSTLPTVFELTGWIYLFGALILGAYFLEPAIQFFRTHTNRAAKRVLTASIVYVPVLVSLIFIDRFVI